MALLALQGRTYDVRILRYAPQLEVSVDGRVHVVEALPVNSPDAVRLRVDGTEIEGWGVADDGRMYLRLNGSCYELTKRDGMRGLGKGDDCDDLICAELPGSLISLHCAVGEEVRSGDLLMHIESMKMEVSVSAPRDGVVEKILIESGRSFERGAPLLRLSADSQDRRQE